MVNLFIEIISRWQVITVGFLLLITLPLIFYIASFDRKPVVRLDWTLKELEKKPQREKPSSENEEESQEDDDDEQIR